VYKPVSGKKGQGLVMFAPSAGQRSVKLEQAPLNNAAGFSDHLSLNLERGRKPASGGEGGP